MVDDKVTELVNVNKNLARRKFLQGVGVAGIGVAAASVLGANTLPQAKAFDDQPQNIKPKGQITDIDILNFALNLEFLEAEYYSVATTGKTLVELGIISASQVGGPTTGGKKIHLQYNKAGWLANALAKDEQTHVVFLLTALGSAAVLKPTINLDALGYGFANFADLLKIGRQFEDVGVSAYLGAAPLIANPAYLAAAGAILATEAQHSGALRTQCVNKGVISPPVDALDVPPTPTTPFDVDSNALSIPRTTSQVLNIVYAGGKCSGGFYPDGMNGTIVCQS